MLIMMMMMIHDDHDDDDDDDDDDHDDDDDDDDDNVKWWHCKKQVVFWNHDDTFSHATWAKSSFRYSGMLIFCPYNVHFLHGRETAGNLVVSNYLSNHGDRKSPIPGVVPFPNGLNGLYFGNPLYP